jgi:hypothetical protein
VVAMSDLVESSSLTNSCISDIRSLETKAEETPGV